MIRHPAALATALLAMTGVTNASELDPGSGHSIQLGRFNGAVYYTIEQDGYRVVATVASGVDEQPIRFVSTLGPGQRMVISVPQAEGWPPIELEIQREGQALLVSDPLATLTTDPVTEEASVLAVKAP